ncbi:MAG: STAS/SEC14 domain-containing protein [Chryseolinea sp.]
MQLETDKIKFTLRPDNIVSIECAPNTMMTLDLGKLSTIKVGEIVKQNPLPLLCDLTNVVKMEQECRRHFAGPEHAAVFTKCALIVNSPLSKIIGNFFLGANKPLRPTRLFTNVEEGLSWLRK